MDERADSQGVADEIHNIHGSIPRPPRGAPVHRDPPKRDRREQEQTAHQGEDTVDLSKDAEDEQAEDERSADPPCDAERTDGGEGGHPHIDLNA